MKIQRLFLTLQIIPLILSVILFIWFLFTESKPLLIFTLISLLTSIMFGLASMFSIEFEDKSKTQKRIYRWTWLISILFFVVIIMLGFAGLIPNPFV